MALLILSHFFLTFIASASALLSDSPECIRYEFHDQSNSNTSSSPAKSMMQDCNLHNGFIDKLTVANISSRPLWLNMTFECCVDSACDTDLDCPFNFQCNTNDRCIVSGCELSDDQDLFVIERIECFFDDDCTFYAPHDNSSSWGCVQTSCNDTSKSCRHCKRCPSEPRTIFNASESLWLEKNDSLIFNDTHVVPKIPPLSILLNSTFYVLGPDDFPVRRTAADADVAFSFNATGDMAINETITGTEREEWTSTTPDPILIPSNDSIPTASSSTTPRNITTSEEAVTEVSSLVSGSSEEEEIEAESASGT